MFDLILYIPSTIFQLNRDGSSWVEPVQSYDKCVLLKDHNAVTLVKLEPATPRSRVKHSTTEPLRSLQICIYPTVLTFVLGVQKNHLIETVLLSIYNKFWLRNNNFIFNYAFFMWRPVLIRQTRRSRIN